MLRSEWGREWEEWAGWFFEWFVVGFCVWLDVWLGVWHCTWLCAWLCTWNGGSGSGVVHCWLAFPVEEVCCYLERGGGAGMVLLVAGVPGGSGMGTPGTEGVNWEGSVQGRRARWKGKVFQVERKVEYGYGRSFYRFTQIMAIRNNGSPRFRIRYKGFESVFFSGTSYSSCFCRARCRSWPGGCGFFGIIDNQ